MLELLLPIIITGILITISVGALVFGLARFIVPIQGALHDRLLDIHNNNQTNSPFINFATGGITWLTKTLNPYAKKIYGDNLNFLSEIRQLMYYAGLPVNESAVWQRLSQQLVFGVGMAVFGFIGGCYWAFTNQHSGNDLLIDIIFGVALCALVGTKLPLIRLKRHAKERQTELYYSLSDVLDLMVVCMEAGLGMDSAMQRVAKETEETSPEMSYELTRTQTEIAAGIPRAKAFQHLTERTTVEEFQALCRMIVQADRLGASIAQAIRLYADELRTKRRQKAEELAQKASVKMMFPLVLFIFPALLIVIIGPGMVQILEMFAK
jgi:tight adherence protein C